MGETTDGQSNDESAPALPAPEAVRPIPLSVMNWETKALPDDPGPAVDTPADVPQP